MATRFGLPALAIALALALALAPVLAIRRGEQLA